MGKAADWLREERRKVLGDWASICLDCGAAQRWFEDFEGELPERCPACHAPFSSVFAVECEQCRGELRPAEVLGVSIRKQETRR